MATQAVCLGQLPSRGRVADLLAEGACNVCEKKEAKAARKRMGRHGERSIAEVSTLARPDLKRLNRRPRIFVSQYGRREDAALIVTGALGHTRMGGCSAP
jgi:hypothetical protein